MTVSSVVVVGSGGREHALGSALGGGSARVVVSPGNAGMAALGVRCSPELPTGADLYVIGPEAPLVDGLADRLRAGGALVLGPGADGARLEGSKAWMKDVLRAAGVPTAGYGSFTEPAPAVEYLRSLPPPWVVKTDGLAAGKGVLVTDDLDEAERDVRAKLSGRSFGDAGTTVVVEEGLEGVELSVMALCDGRSAVALAPARDAKRLGDGDTGPNTGGMGAYSPVPPVDGGLVSEVMQSAILPTLAALADRGVDYRGVLYAGLMLTAAGPKVLEFNVRFGDPETQVVLPRWEGDILGCLAAAAGGHLGDAEPPRFGDDAAVCVVMAAAGYPASPRSGDPLAGLAGLAEGAAPAGLARQASSRRVYCAGVGSAPDGSLVTAGGRVLAVTATGADIGVARSRVYESVEALAWPGAQWRTDIAAGVTAPAGREV